MPPLLEPFPHSNRRFTRVSNPHIVHTSDSTFSQDVLKSDKPVLLDFWAPWCPPCLAIGPSIDQLAVEYQGKAKVGKIDVDSNRNLSLQFNVNNIPCIIVVKNGQVVGRTMGAKSKADFAKMIDAAL